jgi:hypothetical protein
MAYSLMAVCRKSFFNRINNSIFIKQVFKDCVAARDNAQQAAGNDEVVNIDLSPLRVRKY